MVRWRPARWLANACKFAAMECSVVFVWQILDLLAPAVFIGAMSAAAAKVCWRRAVGAVRWSTLAGWSVGPGAVVSLGGVVLTGHDGRMLTYAGVVIACALGLWLRAFVVGGSARR